MSSSAEEVVAPVVLVTGASRGIGKAIAAALAAKGARVVVHYNTSREKAEDVAATLATEASSSSSTHTVMQANISEPKECQRLIADVVAKYGRIDVLVNNAGISLDEDVRNYDYEGWQKQWNDTMDLNYFAATNLMYLASRQFMQQENRGTLIGKGRVVNISSRAAYAGDVTAPAYAVSKNCLNITAQSLAKQLARDDIYFFTVSPGATDTEMWGNILTPEQRKAMDASHPLGRIGMPEEVAAAVCWFALEAPPLMTASVLDANGAMYTH